MRSIDTSGPATGHENPAPPRRTSLFASGDVPNGVPRAKRGYLTPALVGLLGLTTLWGGAASYYLVFHDDVLARFLSQQRAMQIAYEDRVGALQLQIDQAATERSVTRAGLERRLAALFERQAVLETRQGLIAGLTNAGTGSAATGATAPLPAVPTSAAEVPAGPPAAKPFPTPENGDLGIRGGDHSELSERLLGARLTGLEARLEDTLVTQSRTLVTVAARAQRRAERYKFALTSAGLTAARFERGSAGIGGPFVPVRGDAFERALADAQRATAATEQLRRTVQGLPFRKPMDEDAVPSSGFGTRLDPFTRGLAYHTGIDLRADYGAPARATAPGRVSTAEYSGGYGNMVEVDHGNGVATRYAHLATFAVVPGQRVAAGAIVGRVGSTGRSTGNHLHYETRIDGEPVDPGHFLRAAETLDLDAADRL